jgi:hypothetical protein
MSERELCRLCEGNGSIKIPGGVSVCRRCGGDCYEPGSGPLQGWVIDNIYTIARREYRRVEDGKPLRPEMWTHVLRLCEKAGAQSRTVGVLRDGTQSPSVGERTAVDSASTSPERKAESSKRDCTCLGTCKGAGGLGVGWRCVLGRETPQEPRQPDWQPIATAPKDGTWVLVWGPSDTWSLVRLAWYAYNHRSGKAYWKLDGECDDYELAADQPTHWMPLPPPPVPRETPQEPRQPEAPACELHGVMVPDNENGSSWHCAVCGATA